jgi:hypothetical protein
MSKVHIQSIQPEVITLEVDGEIKEIRNQLDELKGLLQNLEVQKVQYAEKIYNIEHINEANFGFVTGKKAFNELFTKSVMQSIQTHCTPAQKFLSRVENIPHWEQQARISDKAKEIIAYSFVGVIGVQLSKLMAIGKEPLSDNKQRKYLDKGIAIIKRSLDLVNFTFLSALWDYQKTQQAQIEPAQKKVLQQFFDRSFEQSIEEQQELLANSWDIFAQNAIPCPFPDFNFTKVSETLRNICTKVQELKRELDRQEYSLLECFAIEQELSRFFDCFAFLAQYEMASIKRIGYKQMRHVAPRYLHRFAALGIDSKANVDAEKVLYTESTVHTDAVLIYTGDHYEQNVNLFPLVIDYNALTFEQGVKICFFQSKDVADGSLEYQFLEDGSIIYVEEQGLLNTSLDYNELMLKPEGQIKLNLDQVVAAFKEARVAILQEEVFLDDL